MPPLDALLSLAAIPLGGAFAALVVSRLLAPGVARVQDLLTGLALGVAYTVTLHLVGIHPDLPLAPHEDAWSWVVWIAPAAALLGATCVAARLPEGPALPVRWAFATGAVWVIVRPLVPHALSLAEALARAGAWGAGAALLATGLVRAARQGGRARLALPTLVAFGATTLLLSWGGRSLTMAAGALALASSVGAAALLTLWSRGPALAETAAPAVATTFVGLLAGAHGYLTYGETVRFPLPSALLLLASAGTVFVPRWRWALALALLLAGGAVALGVHFDETCVPD